MIEPIVWGIGMAVRSVALYISHCARRRRCRLRGRRSERFLFTDVVSIASSLIALEIVLLSVHT